MTDAISHYPSDLGSVPLVPESESDEARRQERLRWLNDPERIARIPEFPMPKRRETADQYKVRVHAWIDAVPIDGDYTPGFLRAEREYICSLAGVDPD